MCPDEARPGKDRKTYDPRRGFQLSRFTMPQPGGQLIVANDTSVVLITVQFTSATSFNLYDLLPTAALTQYLGKVLVRIALNRFNASPAANIYRLARNRYLDGRAHFSQLLVGNGTRLLTAVLDRPVRRRVLCCWSVVCYCCSITTGSAEACQGIRGGQGNRTNRQNCN